MLNILLLTTNNYYSDNYSLNEFIAGYGNTTSAVNAVRFQISHLAT
jgi:hypothetical protein